MTPYGDRNAANDYFQTKLRSVAWDEASNDERDRSLLQATRLVDNLRYEGDKTDADQEHEFPRDGATTVPQAVKDASYEIALKLLQGVDPDLDANAAIVEESAFPGVRTRKSTQTAQRWIMAGIPSKTAWDMLRPFLADSQELTITRE